ncbi:proton-conducting transporter transmembrane domain-containing protein [Leptospira sp. GIMC2001]|uniref:proton-conducting transporter transmembrane domain-containing protein n=1 Tax=Leptospira sp. GIMC2001 TaxID=1513297 RepID=UPI00234AE17B|nr:proton-conducting transporter membrane subunit [Leptospira sp. GIMC2001]WCL48843.1 proton-conducting transporter membrane subunit [Leptospira sp. GIMC2001]
MSASVLIALAAVTLIGILLYPEISFQKKVIFFIQFSFLGIAAVLGKTFFLVLLIELVSILYFFQYTSPHRLNGKSYSSFLISGGISGILLAAWVFLGSENTVGLYFLAFACFLKSGLFFLHFWIPLAYENVDAEINSFSSGLFVLFPFYIFITFVYPYMYEPSIFLCITVVAAIGIFVGGITSFFQLKVSQVLAYSSIEKLNFIWLCIGLAGLAKTAQIVEFQDLENGFIAVFYISLIQHSVSKTFQFLLFGRVENKDNSSIDKIRGKGRSLGLPIPLTLLGTLSFIGIPGTTGFISESSYLLLSSSLLEIPSSKSIVVLPVLILVFTGIVFGGASHIRLYQSIFLSPYKKDFVDDSMKSDADIKNNLNFLNNIKNKLDLIWLGIWIVLPSLFLPVYFRNFFPMNISSYVLDASLLSLLTIVIVCSIAYFTRNQKFRKLTWDTGANSDLRNVSISASSYSIPLIESLGKHFMSSKGKSKLDDWFMQFFEWISLRKYYKPKNQNKPEDLSNYLALSSIGILSILFIFFALEFIGGIL